MKHILRFLAVGTLGLLPEALRADSCDTVRDLRDLYVGMDAAYNNNGRLPVDQARELRLMAARLHPEMSRRALLDTEIAGRASVAIQPLITMRGASPTQVADEVILSGLEAARTGQSVIRAMDVLSRLDCPKPVVERQRRDNQVWDAAVSEADPATIALHYGGGGAALGLICLLVALIHASFERRNRRKQRHACSIPVTFGGATGWENALVLDMSQEGLKLGVTNAGAPEKDAELKVKIGETEIGATVRWGNSHVFGATFERLLDEEELATLLKLSKTRSRTTYRRPKDRAPKEEEPQTQNGTPEGAAQTAE